MTEIKGKVAVVTGASSGIGAAIVTVLLEAGMKVVGLARRVEKIEELGKSYKGSLFAVKTDLNKEDDIQAAIKWIAINVGAIDVLINNAGVANVKPIHEADPKDIAAVLNTNLLGATLFMQASIKDMIANKTEGTIINVGSVTGHYIIGYPEAFGYTASKFGLRAMTESIRREIARTGSKIRITHLSPGLVFSEMTSRVPTMLDNNPHLQSEDIANSVKYIITLPQNVNIAELTIRPTGESM